MEHGEAMTETLEVLDEYYDLITISPGGWCMIKVIGFKGDVSIEVTATNLEDALQRLLWATVRAAK